VHLVRLAFFLTCAAAWAQNTRVILLGAGTPNPEPDRMGPAVAVVSGDRVYIVDCGPGVVRRAAQAGIRTEQLTRAFISHLHCDHTARCFEARDKVIAIGGDTSYNYASIAAAKGCDIPVHELSSQKGWEGRTPEWRRYHAAYHTSGPDVGRVAAQVRPKKLVLYHLLPMGQTADEVLGEVRRNWQGEAIYAKDLDVIR
jgi:ribonuclease BN (tRNA processing enzyme)